MSGHSAEKDVPTMSRAECQCPDDCDCDGRFACEVQPTGCDGTWTCELVVGHDGWHQDGSHRWAPCVTSPAAGGRARLDKYGSTLDAENVRLLCERIADYPEVIAAVDALRTTVLPPVEGRDS